MSSHKEKVLIITYYWPPGGGPGVQRWLKFSRFLPEYGIEPVILTVDPKKASYQITDESLLKESSGIETYYTSTIEPFGIFKKTSGSEKLPLGGGNLRLKNSFFKKIFLFIRGNLFIPDPRRGWNYFAFRKAKEIIKKYSIKTVITSSPPHSTQLIGIRLKKKFNIKWIADFRDPWTDIYYYNDFLHTSLAKKIDRFYEKKSLKLADDIIVVSESIKQVFKTKIREEFKIKVIPNGFDETDFISTIVSEKSEFRIVYTGTINLQYGVAGFLTAVEELKNEIQLKLSFIGSCDDSVKELINKKKLDSITEFISYVDHKKSTGYLQKGSALLLCIPEIENNEGILTGKLFEYLAARKPIIAVGPVYGDAAKILSDCETGVMFDYADIGGIKNFIYRIYKGDYNINLNNTGYTKFSRRLITGQLSELIKR